ncbi:hypothetical protein LS73_001055 [Helicobacter muridarum]|uniref:Probable membrane transporter protein n=1 Tax=Helicobacter muridarum TaxID=216 RepID=A0A099TXF5_9HELI|nr:TSUP family transporter [Helicobacter muridarum]TLE01305.1 hypothetical protein LS73_001055 [Helicobacter muridarum]STQ87173.1 putative permease [Helicobacter muridarum]
MIDVVIGDISIDTLGILVLVAFVAGLIDSIAGGGGMITIPSLWLAGIPPHIALGTNKLQSCFGSFSAALHFYKKGFLNLKNNLAFVISVFIFASLGALLVRAFDAEFLSKCIPFLLIIFAFYFLFSPKVSNQESKPRSNRFLLGIVFGIIGFYDGFFGPGTGSFFMLAGILLGGFNITSSLAHAKLYNFISNFASLLIFALGGQVLWILGITMGVGQFLGANIGSRLAIRYGVKIIKPLVVIVSLVMCVKLLFFT